MRIQWIFAALGFAALSLTQTAHAQIALSSTFAIGVRADANQNDADSHWDYILQSQYGTLNPYSGSLSVRDRDLVNAGYEVTVKSSASASWTDAGHGIVTWRDMGWIQNTIASSGTQLNDFVVNGPVWGYSFQATESGTFTLNYDVRGSGNTFGLLGVDIGWTGTGGGQNLIDPYDPTCNGVFSREVIAGNNYRVELRNHGNHFTSPDLHQYTAMMNADFAWSIQAQSVPEPASLSVLGLGLFALGKRTRNRKNRAK